MEIKSDISLGPAKSKLFVYLLANPEFKIRLWAKQRADSENSSFVGYVGQLVSFETKQNVLCGKGNKGNFFI